MHKVKKKIKIGLPVIQSLPLLAGVQAGVSEKHPLSDHRHKMLISERREMLSLMLDTFNPCSLLAETRRELQQLRPSCCADLEKKKEEKTIWRHHSVG